MKDKTDGLLPFFKRVLLAHKIACLREFKKQNIGIYYYCGFRSTDEQNALYAIGRNGDKRKTVTNAKGGDSFHQYGMAIDFVPVAGGKLLWQDEETYRKFGEMAEALGIDWGGSWAMKDMPHLELTGGLTIGNIHKLSMHDIAAHIESWYSTMGFDKVLKLVEDGGFLNA